MPRVGRNFDLRSLLLRVLLVNLGKCADVVQAVYEKHNLLELP